MTIDVDRLLAAELAATRPAPRPDRTLRCAAGRHHACPRCVCPGHDPQLALDLDTGNPQEANR